jgi:ABC-type multidrug transport system fused ATPase/permease subunit
MLQGTAINSALGLQTPGGGGSTMSLQEALLNLAFVGVATAVATGMRGMLFWICGARLTSRLRNTIFTALLAQPIAFHDSQSAAALSSRLATDCVKLGDVLSLNINVILRQVWQSVLGVAIVAQMNLKLAALVLAGVAMRGVLSHFYAKASRALAQAQQDALAVSSALSGPQFTCFTGTKVTNTDVLLMSEGPRQSSASESSRLSSPTPRVLLLSLLALLMQKYEY